MESVKHCPPLLLSTLRSPQRANPQTVGGKTLHRPSSPQQGLVAGLWATHLGRICFAGDLTKGSAQEKEKLLETSEANKVD